MENRRRTAIHGLADLIEKTKKFQGEMFFFRIIQRVIKVIMQTTIAWFVPK